MPTSYGQNILHKYLFHFYGTKKEVLIFLIILQFTQKGLASPQLSKPPHRPRRFDASPLPYLIVYLVKRLKKIIILPL